LNIMLTLLNADTPLASRVIFSLSEARRLFLLQVES
jgi:hypothetical protein